MGRRRFMKQLVYFDDSFNTFICRHIINPFYYKLTGEERIKPFVTDDPDFLLNFINNYSSLEWEHVVFDRLKRLNYEFKYIPSSKLGEWFFEKAVKYRLIQ
jgi:hypothetical protein